MDAQKLRDYFSRTKGTRYPFPGHRLAGEDSYVKNLYLKHLAMLLCCGRGVSEEQTLFLQRLVSGCGGEYDLETYMRQGQEAAPESLEELLAQLKPGGLREPFVLDALLLAHLGEPEDVREELLAALCEASRVKLPELGELAELCGKILRLELCNCILSDLSPDRFLQEGMWKPYFPDTVTPEWKNTDDCLIAAAGKPVRLDVTTALEVEEFTRDFGDVLYQDAKRVNISSRKLVCFYNLEIPMNVHIQFTNVDEVRFINCSFKGDGAQLSSESASIWLDSCLRIQIKDCTFRNFGGRTIHILNKNESVAIEGCEFADCIFKYSNSNSTWDEIGGVIYTNRVETYLHLKDTHFTNCGGYNAYRSSWFCAASIISNCITQIHHCRFENCWNVYETISGRAKDANRYGKLCLFMYIAEESDNEIVDSAELKPR